MESTLFLIFWCIIYKDHQFAVQFGDHFQAGPVQDFSRSRLFAIVIVFIKSSTCFSERESVTIEYTSEPIRIQRGPKLGLCKQYDDLPIVSEDERNAQVSRGSQLDDDLWRIREVVYKFVSCNISSPWPFSLNVFEFIFVARQ